MKVDPQRETALDILLAVDRRAPLDSRLDAALDACPGDRERAFLAELVKGTTVWRGRYDHLVDRLSRRQPPRGRVVREVLRLGLHQLLAMDGVPPHAALDQSAELARRRCGAKMVGYVNGLLRAVQRRVEKAEGAVEVALRPLFPDLARERVAALAAWHSFPPWLVERWLDRLGPAACEELCRALNRRPPVTLHVLPPADPIAVAVALDAAGYTVNPEALHPRALTLQGRRSRRELATMLDRFPALVVQDAAVQSASDYLLGDTEGPAVDLCAAPGGKTFHWAALRPEARPLLAMDRSRPRLGLMRGATKRIEAGPTGMVLADAGCPPLAPGTCAAVLLDGPCSGTGVLRRHPEGRWRLSRGVIAAGGDRLRELARAAAELLAPGGCLLYGTCSLEPEENEAVISALRRECPDLEPAPGPGGDAEGIRRWWPHLDGADGFFAARLRRR